MSIRYKDLTGEKFGLLIVMGKAERNDLTKPVKWVCKCECGNICTPTTCRLNSGKTRSCGCLRVGHPMENLIGKKFNLLTVISFKQKDSNKHVRWNCVCDCGNTTCVLAYNLKNGAVKSCGCLMGGNTTHGLTNSRLYDIFDNMKARCYRPTNDSYKNYGGRGIAICQEWLDDFMNFYDWAINNGYSENLTIERNNVNEGYSPNNCSWVTMLEQAQNKRNTLGKEKVIEIRQLLKAGLTYTEIGKMYGFYRESIMRIDKGITYKNVV